MKRVFLGMVRLYQLTISPILMSLGGGCRFHPSCSDYSKEAFQTFGVLKALGLTLWRILRCNPFNAGGLDPVNK